MTTMDTTNPGESTFSQWWWLQTCSAFATLGGRPMMGKMDIRKAKKRIGVEKAHPQLNPGGMRIRSCHKKQPSRREASEQASRRAKR